MGDCSSGASPLGKGLSSTLSQFRGAFICFAALLLQRVVSGVVNAEAISTCLLQPLASLLFVLTKEPLHCDFLAQLLSPSRAL